MHVIHSRIWYSSTLSLHSQVLKPTFQQLLHGEMRDSYKVLGEHLVRSECSERVMHYHWGLSVLDSQHYSLVMPENTITQNGLQYWVFNYYFYLYLFKHTKPNIYTGYLWYLSSFFSSNSLSIKAILMIIFCSSLNRLHSESVTWFRPIGYNFENHSSNKIAFYWSFKKTRASYNFNFLQ